MSQKKEQESLYGNVSLGQIVKFIVEIVGKDALEYFDVVKENTLKDAYQERGSYEKFKVDPQDYAFQFTYENSIFGKIYQFFEKLEKDFGISEYPKDLFMNYFTEQLLVQIASQRIFEVKQSDLVIKIVFDQHSIDLQQNESLPFNPQFNDYVKTFSTLNFSDLLTEFLRKISMNLEDFYSEISNRVEISSNDKLDWCRRSIQRCRKENIFPAWAIFYAILKFVNENDDEEKSFTNGFLCFYFYHNFRSALQNISVKKEVIVEFEKLVQNFNEVNYKAFFEKYLDVKKTGLNDNKKWFAYFDSILAKNTIENVRKFQFDLPRLQNELPHSISFWQNWFAAKDCVFKYMENGSLSELENSVKWYKAAFNDGKYFAGKSLEQFLHEAMAVSFYYDWKSNPKQTRDRIQKSSEGHDTKTPISRDTNVFYDFANAFGFVLNKREDAFNYIYHCCENFWNVFPPQTDQANKMRSENFLDELGIQISTEDIEKSITEKLQHVTDKNINTRLSSERNVAYTPLSYAICWCEWNFVKDFLDPSKFPSLDVNIPNSNNTYPISELLTKYKSDTYSSVCGDLRYLNRTLPRTEEECLELFSKILDKTEKKVLSTTQSNHRKISVLQEALETFDMRFIKPVVDKMTENGNKKFSNDFRISADELSPLYYAIQLKHFFNTPFDVSFNQMMAGGNVRWENLAVPGMTKEQKQAYEENVFYGDLGKFTDEILNIKRITRAEAIKSGKFEKCNNEIDAAISLLIERTNDVDTFVTYPDGEKQHFRTVLHTNHGTIREKVNPEYRQGINCLFYAAEADDTETCRKLINAGADVKRQIGKTSCVEGICSPNSFVYRLIFYKSWKTLRMFLKEFKDKASLVMHRENSDITPLVFFIMTAQIEMQKGKYMSDLEFRDMIHYFQDAGASMNEETKIGTAGNFLKVPFRF